jgi:cell fate regulator YaaT (PSP1 superfamily)
MNDLEYLVSYGLAGDFGRFQSPRPLPCRRGARVVVRSYRGLEVGSVLRAATPRHAAFLPNTTVGQLLRGLTPDDEQTLDTMRQCGRRLCERAAALADELALPLEVLDAEVLLDGQHAALHLLRRDAGDVRPFVSTLSREFALHIEIADLAHAAEEEEHHGCGREGCGREGGGCGSCGTGGGCGSCGTKAAPDMTAYFAQLREQMESRRVGLL